MSALAINFKIFGPLLIGIVVTGVLLGVSILQAYYYYRNHNDRWNLKHLVTIVMGLGTCHQAFYTYSVYHYIVHPEEEDTLILDLAILTTINAVISFLIQSFLTLRVWRLSNRNIWLISIIILILVAEYSTVIAGLAIEFIWKKRAALEKIEPFTITISLLSGTSDLIIALALCVLLHLSRTGCQRSDTLINKLIVFTVNTGLITSFCALGAFVALMASPTTFIYVAIYMCTGRLYINTFLASLNARKMLRVHVDNYTINEQVTLPLRGVIHQFRIDGIMENPIYPSKSPRTTSLIRKTIA